MSKTTMECRLVRWNVTIHHGSAIAAVWPETDVGSLEEMEEMFPRLAPLISCMGGWHWERSLGSFCSPTREDGIYTEDELLDFLRVG